MRVTSNQDLLNLDNILSWLEIKAINKGQSSLSIVSSTSPFSSSFLPFLTILEVTLTKAPTAEQKKHAGYHVPLTLGSAYLTK